MAFRVGQRVVCVDDRFHARVVRARIALPRKGEIYTVRECVPTKFWAAVRVNELRSDPIFEDELTGQNVEAAFPIYRFRPVVERKTDIAVFTEILDRVNGKISERV